MNNQNANLAQPAAPPGPNAASSDHRPESLQAAKQRERDFLQLLEGSKAGLTRFCWAMARNEQDAADLLSETILQVWQAFPTMRDRQAFPKFCLTVARRTAASFWRRRLWHKSNPTEADGAAWTELVADTSPPDIRSDIERLHAALKQLPRKQREAIALFDLTGFSLKEIQEIQGGSLSGVKSRLRRGREQLAELLGARISIESGGKRVNATKRHQHTVDPKNQDQLVKSNRQTGSK